MRLDDVIAKLRANADAIRGFGVTALYLYGSAARDEVRDTSDIDLFADVDYDRFGFVPFMELRDFLKSIFQRNVDITTRNALHPDLKSRILKSAVKVFDEKKIDLLRLNDIIRAIDGATDTIGSNDFETFQKVYHMPRTIERCIEIVSEATRHLPAELKLHYPGIPWQPIAGIGNVLRHDYDIVDERIIWEVATVHFPELRKVIIELKAQLPEEDE